jgi:hypothetical protein
MKSLAFAAIAAFALTACAGLPQSQQGASQPGASSVAANAAPADEPEAADASEDLAEGDSEPAPKAVPEPAKTGTNPYMKADGDDYRYVSGMTGYSARPYWKGQRQLEIEKIHTLSKACIAANNTSKACNDLIALNSRMGKFYILQETSRGN